MTKPISLGRKLNSMVSIEPFDSDKEHYPDLCIESDDRTIAEMPDTGTATIKYRVRSRTHREEKNGKGKEYSCTLRLEVLSIEPPEGKRQKNGSYGDDARKALNGYFKDK